MERIYEQCYTIRAFEKKVEKEFEKGLMRGTTHACIGQEIIPVLVMKYIDKENDVITGTHRCHGQVLAYTDDPYALACEMMGKQNGFNAGMGGSQHIKYDRYITNGVTGGMAAVGAGIAFSLKKKGKGIVVAFLGDGGFSEGYVMETINMAQTYQVPILYVMENNKYAMSTCTKAVTSGTVEERIKAQGMEYGQAVAYEVEKLERKIEEAVSFVRENKAPFFLEVETFRLCGHSKSDGREYMTEEEKQENLENDPLLKISEMITEEKVQEIHKRVSQRIENAFLKASDDIEMDYAKYREKIKC